MKGEAAIQKDNSPEIQSECAMFAVFVLPGKHIDNVQGLIYQGLTDQQHRAEGSAGTYVSDGISSEIVKDLGTVAVAFHEGRNLPKMEQVSIAVGHTRYPTAGKPNHKANIQPLQTDNLILAHHGNLTNMAQVKSTLQPFKMGGNYPDNDTWIALNAIAQAEGSSLGEKVATAQRKFEGAWDFLVSDGNTLVASRDPHGIRPFSLVRLGPKNNQLGYAIAVENSAFYNLPDSLEVSEPVDILPGQTIEMSEKGLRQVDKKDAERQYFCIFEYIYMSRPDTVHNGLLVADARRQMGRLLAEKVDAPEDKIVVMPVPDSGRGAEIALLQRMLELYGDKVTPDEGLIANRYYGRNFIKSLDKRRANLKFSTLRPVVEGQHIVIVDDSIVRGDTLKDNVQMLRDAGAAKIDVVIACPELLFKCLWGVAFPTNEELLANKYPDFEERKKFLGVDGLFHLSLEDLQKCSPDLMQLN